MQSTLVQWRLFHTGPERLFHTGLERLFHTGPLKSVSHWSRKTVSHWSKKTVSHWSKKIVEHWSKKTVSHCSSIYNFILIKEKFHTGPVKLFILVQGSPFHTSLQKTISHWARKDHFTLVHKTLFNTAGLRRPFHTDPRMTVHSSRGKISST